MSKFDLELFRQLWKASQAGTIPPVWIDEFVIRVKTPEGMRRISDRQARELLKGKTVDQILEDIRERHDAYVFSRKLDWVYRQSSPNPRFPKDQKKVSAGRSNQEKQMKKGTPEHPKMIQLADKLDIPLPYAIGVMELLWHFTGQYAKHGNIGKYSNRLIADKMQWRGDHDKLINALVESGWVDVHEKHRLIVHDWAEHCDDYIHSQIARAREYFADGSIPKTRHLKGSEREEAANFYYVHTSNPGPDTNQSTVDAVDQSTTEDVDQGVDGPHPQTRMPCHAMPRHATPVPCHALPSSSKESPPKKKPDDDEKTKIEVIRAQLVAWRYSPTKRGSGGQEYRPRPDDDVCRQVLRECEGSTDLLAEFLREKSKVEPVVNGWGWFPQAIRNQLAGVVA